MAASRRPAGCRLEDFVDLGSLCGRPSGWPPIFLERYIVIDEVADAYPALAPV
jgi:hypothetical protein